MKPLTMEAFLNLDPDGERAAILAGLAPEGVPNPYGDDVTELGDVLATLGDFVGDALPGDLGDEALRVFEKASQAVESRQDGDFHVLLKQGDAAVEVAYDVDDDGAQMTLVIMTEDEILKVSVSRTPIMTRPSFGNNGQIPDYLRDLAEQIGERLGASVEFAYG